MFCYIKKSYLKLKTSKRLEENNKLPHFTISPLKLEKERWTFHRKTNYCNISIKKKSNQSQT